MEQRRRPLRGPGCGGKRTGSGRASPGRQMREGALHGASREIPQYQSSHAALMLLAFAMERALKAWHLRTTGKAAKRTHRLLALYEALPEEVRECLDETAGTVLRPPHPPYLSKTGSGRSRLAEVLEAHDTAFQDWRYPEEVLADRKRPNGLFFETGEHEAALDAVLEAFDRPAKNGVRVVHMGTLGNAGARTTMRPDERGPSKVPSPGHRVDVSRR